MDDGQLFRLMLGDEDFDDTTMLENKSGLAEVTCISYYTSLLCTVCILVVTYACCAIFYERTGLI